MQIDGLTLQQAVSKCAVAALLARHYPATGSRHNFALALAGGLLRSGLDESEVRKIVLATAEAAGDEETVDRLRTVETTAFKINGNLPIKGWPTLIDLIGEFGQAVVSRIHEWLDLPRHGSIEADLNPEVTIEGPGSLPFSPAPIVLRSSSPEANWIIRGYLPKSGSAQFYAKEGGGKSRISWQLAYAVAEGLPSWCGLPVENHGAVLYLELDMPQGEFAHLLSDAAKAGVMSERIICPNVDLSINMLEDKSRRILSAAHREWEFVLAIIDTCYDSFYAERIDNQLIGRVIKFFRDTLPGVGLHFTNHERRQSAYAKARGFKDDDPFLGWGEWARRASASVRLVGVNDEYAELHVKKGRYQMPWSKLTLRRGPYGFFEIAVTDASGNPTLDHKQALALWPHFPGADPATCDGIRAVCRQIAELTNAKEDTVYKFYKRERERGVIYPWLSRFKTEGDQHDD